MNEWNEKERYSLADLLHIVALLRRPEGGCPWDCRQTHESLKSAFVEETYEVLDAIDRQNPDMLCEELGDVLLQVAFHAQLEAEAGRFTFDEVCDGICKKLIYRHPHVFGEAQAAGARELTERWDALKEQEKGLHTASENLAAVPASLPALMRAKKLQKRAERYGFACGGAKEALKGADSALEKLKAGTDEEKAQALGEALFSLTDAGRYLGLDAEEALGAASARFTARVSQAEKEVSPAEALSQKPKAD